MTPVRNFPGGFVERMIGVPRKQQKHQSSPLELQNNDKQVTSTATHWQQKPLQPSNSTPNFQMANQSNQLSIKKSQSRPELLQKVYMTVKI